MRSTKSIRIPVDLYNWLKYESKNEGLSLGEFLNLHLRDIRPPKSDNRGKRKRPSVAVAVSTSSSIEDLEDWRRKYEGVPNWARVVD